MSENAAPAAAAAASSKAQQQQHRQGKDAPPVSTATTKQQTVLLISLDNVIPSSRTAEEAQSATSSTTAPIPLPLALGQLEREHLIELNEGGITAFRGLPLQALKQYIGIVMRPDELTEQNLPKLFNDRKEEFVITAMYAPVFIDRGVRLGMLPMTIRMHSSLPEFLALKLHIKRCTVQLSPQSQIPHGVRGKKSRKLALVVDGDLWETCLGFLTAQQERTHGHSWLNEYLNKAYRQLNLDTVSGNFHSSLHCISVVHADKVPQLSEARSKLRDARSALQAVAGSVKKAAAIEDNGNSSNNAALSKLNSDLAAAQQEFNDVARSAFCAGEFGVTNGAIYTSLTGCFAVSGTGSVQLGAMVALLVQCGYQVLDLGMQMDYKKDELGGREVPRKQWQDMAKAAGAVVPQRKLSDLDGYVVRADLIIEAALPVAAATSSAQQNNNQAATKQDAASAAAKAT